MKPTPVFEAYWKFATERQAIFHRRLSDPTGPWTNDPILTNYRFTNAFRASDRVSQYLIGEIQYNNERPQAANEVFFRTILFKIFNKIDTWRQAECFYGAIEYETMDWDRLLLSFERLHSQGHAVYSGAYIMPSPNFGHVRKYANHLALLKKMMDDRVPERLAQTPSLQDAYEIILRYPGVGPFLAFQYAIDLNYSPLLNFSENDFVVAGPGAIDGISKCFSDAKSYRPEDIIESVTNDQDFWFDKFGQDFQPLFGRKLHLIDCQNLFCEISKYSRVSHPEYVGVAGRTRIKQSYRFDSMRLPKLSYPPKWGLKAVTNEVEARRSSESRITAYGRLL